MYQNALTLHLKFILQGNIKNQKILMQSCIINCFRSYREKNVSIKSHKDKMKNALFKSNFGIFIKQVSYLSYVF